MFVDIDPAAHNLNRLGIDDSIIQAILRHSDAALTQRCYIKTVRSDAVAAMGVLERSLKYAPNMHLSGGERTRLM